MMWTVCWTDEKGIDQWDRMTKEELISFIKQNENVVEDALIFPPEAEALMMDGLFFKEKYM